MPGQERAECSCENKRDQINVFLVLEIITLAMVVAEAHQERPVHQYSLFSEWLPLAKFKQQLRDSEGYKEK